MSERDRYKFEKMLALHSAPTLLGVKCANLFSVDQTEFHTNDVESYFNGKGALNGFSVRCLCRCKQRVLVYVYHKVLLEMWFSDERVSSFLKEFGYVPSFSVNEKLDILEERISCDSFPHEIGIFLGYPLDDVLGFIKNGGTNCLFCGFWKVYSEPEKAKTEFDKYVYCRNYLCNNIDRGVDLCHAMANFKEETL